MGIILLHIRSSLKVARKVAVVVGAWVGTVVPIERRPTVSIVVRTDTCGKGGLVIGLPDVGDDQGWIPALHHTGVALFAILPTPVRIVGIIADQF
ncbi:Uncharacterised protein [Chlamydia trachomatis]|nr:Uncharacterised protein [Chlamydia trachomatis]